MECQWRVQRNRWVCESTAEWKSRRSGHCTAFWASECHNRYSILVWDFTLYSRMQSLSQWRRTHKSKLSGAENPMDLWKRPWFLVWYRHVWRRSFPGQGQTYGGSPEGWAKENRRTQDMSWTSEKRSARSLDIWKASEELYIQTHSSTWQGKKLIQKRQKEMTHESNGRLEEQGFRDTSKRQIHTRSIKPLNGKTSASLPVWWKKHGVLGPVRLGFRNEATDMERKRTSLYNSGKSKVFERGW